jgi:hypothetical protein
MRAERSGRAIAVVDDDVARAPNQRASEVTWKQFVAAASMLVALSFGLTWSIESRLHSEQVFNHTMLGSKPMQTIT